MPEKVFDVLIKSKYTPDGMKGAIAGLKSFGEASTFIRSGIIQPMMQAGQVVLDFIGKANPERIKNFEGAINSLQTSVGNLLDKALGPAIDKLGQLANDASLLANIGQNLEPIYNDIIKRGKQAGLSADELADQLKGASDAAVAATAREKAANPGFFLGVNAEDAAVKVDKLKTAILDQSRTWDEYSGALMRAGVHVKNIRDEIDAFNAAKGIKPPPLADNSGILAQVQANEAKLTDLRENAEIERARFLDDLATRNMRAQQAREIQNARQREDLARQNAENLRNIDTQLAAAVSKANSDLATSLAQIAQDGADQRLQIEENYQEQLRQINQSSGASIEDAIEARDARALSKALQSRSQQLNDAARNHDKALADQAAAEAKSKAQAEKAHEQALADSQQAADDQAAALKKAMSDLLSEQKRANEQAADDQKIADAQAFLDQNTANTRKLQDQKRSNDNAVSAETKKYNDMVTAYQKYLSDIERKTKEWQVSSTFQTMLENAIKKGLSEMFGIQL